MDIEEATSQCSNLLTKPRSNNSFVSSLLLRPKQDLWLADQIELGKHVMTSNIFCILIKLE